jgi:hypothetical protein
VIQLGEVLQDRNTVFQEKVSHGERAMSTDRQMGDGIDFVRKGVDQLCRIGLGKCEGKRNNGQVWLNLLAEVGQ